MEAVVAQALFTLAMLLIFGGFFVWALRTGQFRGVEEANRQLFADRGPNDGAAGGPEDEPESADEGEVPR